MTWFKNHIEGIIRTVVHAALMGGSIYISAHPEYAPYVPVLQYLGQAIDSPR